jgi:hypothetical protein
MYKPRCPFCGLDPYHYEHNGLGYEAVAVNCCELGRLLISTRDKKIQKIAALKSSGSARKQARFRREVAKLNNEW